MPFELAQLTAKVVTLCLLITGQRGQTVWLMDIRNMSWTKTEVRCRIGDLAKTSCPGTHQQELAFEAFPPDRRLCPVTYLCEYYKRTKPLRGPETELFVTWRADSSCKYFKGHLETMDKNVPIVRACINNNNNNNNNNIVHL